MKNIILLLTFVALFGCVEDEPTVNEPVASFTITTTSETVYVGTNVFFTNTSELANTFYWMFGDGETSTEASPVHAYAAAGDYDVTLVAYDDFNANGIRDSEEESDTSILVINILSQE